VLVVAGVAAWGVDAEPDSYLRTRYPLEYAHIVRAHARNYELDPKLLDGRSGIAGLAYSALGAGALVGSLVAVVFVKKFPPLRLAAVGVLAFSIPLWVLPFLPPWPVVFGARFLATFFAPLINGRRSQCSPPERRPTCGRR